MSDSHLQSLHDIQTISVSIDEATKSIEQTAKDLELLLKSQKRAKSPFEDASQLMQTKAQKLLALLHQEDVLISADSEAVRRFNKAQEHSYKILYMFHNHEMNKLKTVKTVLGHLLSESDQAYVDIQDSMENTDKILSSIRSSGKLSDAQSKLDLFEALSKQKELFKQEISDGINLILNQFSTQEAEQYISRMQQAAFHAMQSLSTPNIKQDDINWNISRISSAKDQLRDVETTLSYRRNELNNIFKSVQETTIIIPGIQDNITLLKQTIYQAKQAHQSIQSRYSDTTMLSQATNTVFDLTMDLRRTSAQLQHTNNAQTRYKVYLTQNSLQ